MRIFFLIFPIFVFSFVQCDEEEIQLIAKELLNRQIKELFLAVKENNYEMINKLYFIPEIFPRDESAYEEVRELFTDCQYNVKVGNFVTKSILDAYLDKVTVKDGQKKTELWRIIMKRNAWSPTDWKVFSLNQNTS